MIWLALILATGAVLYAAWCARECERNARRAERAALDAEDWARQSAESLRIIREITHE